MLRSLNPSYRRDIVPGNTALSALRLPVGDVARFIDMQDSVYAAGSSVQKRAVVDIAEEQVAPAKKGKKRGRDRGQRVTVRRGDTLSTIARRNGTTVSKLRRLNGLRGNSIRAGQKIRVR
jgi:membrane-bound lytic murein transglycosylase D